MGSLTPLADARKPEDGDELHSIMVFREDSRAGAAERVRAHLAAGLAVGQACLADEALLDAARRAVEILRRALRRGGKIVLFGNGGSAADAQHLAADLVGRLAVERAPIPAIALTADTAVLTALGNDYGYAQVFGRQIEGLVTDGDAVIALSTSGRSENVLEGVRAARRVGAGIVAMTGRDGGDLADLADVAIRVPADVTAHVQEAHITIGHALCAVLEEDRTS